MKAFLITFLIFLLLLTGFLQTKTVVTRSGVEAARFAVIESAGDRGTFDITESCYAFGDKAKLNGKQYGDKPPLFTFLGLGWYRVLQQIAGIRFDRNREIAVFCVNLLFYCLSALTVLFFHLAVTQKHPEIPFAFRLTGAALAFFSTLVLPYSLTIGNHGVCAMLLCLLLWHLEKTGREPEIRTTPLLTGLLAGTLFNGEFVLGGAAGLCTGIFYLTGKKDRLRNVLCYAAGGLLMILLEGLLNRIHHGSFLPLYLLTHHPEMAGKNILLYAFQALFGGKGFFLHTPVLLLGLAPLFRKDRMADPVRVCMLSIVLLSILIFLTVTSDLGGFCYAFRFLVPLSPVLFYFLWCDAGKRLAVWRKEKGYFLLLSLLILWGLFTAKAGCYDPWCAGYEGSLTKKGNFNEEIRCSCLAMVFVQNWEQDPDSRISRFLLERVYGPKVGLYYLLEEFYNTGNVPMQQKAAEEIQKRQMP